MSATLEQARRLPSAEEETVSTSVRIPESLHKLIEDTAKEDGISKSAVILRALARQLGHRPVLNRAARLEGDL